MSMLLNPRCQPGASTSGRERRGAHAPSSLLPLTSKQLVYQRPTAATAATRKTISLPPSIGVDDGYYRIVRKGDIEPDFDDPEWIDKVEDWKDFWNYTRWDQEVEDLQDVGTDEYTSPKSALIRAQKLMNALRDISDRQDIAHYLPEFDDAAENEENWLDPPAPVEFEDPNPQLSYCDLRAAEEKKRMKLLLDLEWRKRQSMLDLLDYPHKRGYLDKIIYLNEHRWQYRKWREEEVYNLIIMDGLACRPEDHKGIVENPFCKADYHGEHNVRPLEETEEWLERHGHWASPRLHKLFDTEIELREEAFSSDYVAQVFGAAPDEAAWREEQLREGALAQHNTRAELGGVPAEWELGMASRATDNEVERLYDALEQDDDEDGFFYGHGEGFEEDGEGEEVASQQV